jgi:ribosomal protein RSM22 (predicted rRNA methylase)
MTNPDREQLYRAHFPDGSTRLLTKVEVDALLASKYGSRVIIEPVSKA